MGDLIVRSRDRNRCTVHSFIDVLVDVLDCLYRSIDLDVNM
jgi:hypothetical protein